MLSALNSVGAPILGAKVTMCGYSCTMHVSHCGGNYIVMVAMWKVVVVSIHVCVLLGRGGRGGRRGRERDSVFNLLCLHSSTSRLILVL